MAGESHQLHDTFSLPEANLDSDSDADAGSDLDAYSDLDAEAYADSDFVISPIFIH